MVNWELSKQGICWAESHDRLGTQVPTLHKFCCCCCCFVLSFLYFLLTLSWRVISFRLITGLSERKASIQFSLNLILISTSGDVWLHSMSTLEIRKEGTSLFYSRVEWTSAFKGFFQVCFSWSGSSLKWNNISDWSVNRRLRFCNSLRECGKMIARSVAPQRSSWLRDTWKVHQRWKTKV